jgi:FkbM family methyltransferase
VELEKRGEMNILNTRHGQLMVRRGPDLISNYLAQQGEYEWGVVDLCRLLAGNYEDGIVFDIGANMGTVTVPLAKALPQYQFISYEPQKQVYYQLCGNVALNDLYNVDVRNWALGREHKNIWIDMPDYQTNQNIGAWSMSDLVREKSTEAKAGGKQQYVRQEVLNDVHCEKRVRLIKMDVEGMELEILRGANYFLQEHEYPPLVYECWTQFDWYKETAAQLEEYVCGMGYETHHIGNTIVALNPENPLKTNVIQEEGNVRFEVPRNAI